MKTRNITPLGRNQWLTVLVVLCFALNTTACNGFSLQLNSGSAEAAQGGSYADASESKGGDNSIVTLVESLAGGYPSGLYLAGIDIPAGEYVICVTSENLTYFAITSDTSGSLASIIANGNFRNRTIVTVEAGEYLHFTAGRLYPIDEAPRLTGGTLPEGMYKIGVDLPAGEYLARSTTTIMGSLAIFPNSRHSICELTAIQNFNGELLFQAVDGQYLQLSKAELVVR